MLNWCYYSIFLITISSAYPRHTYLKSKSFSQEPVFSKSIKPLQVGPDTMVSITDSKSTESLSLIFPDFRKHLVPDETKKELSQFGKQFNTRTISGTKKPPVDVVEMISPDSKRYAVPIHFADNSTNSLSRNDEQLDTRLARSPTSSSTESSKMLTDSKEHFIPLFRAVNESDSKYSKLISKFFDMEKFKIIFTKSKVYFDSEDYVIRSPGSDEHSMSFSSSGGGTTEVNGKYVQNGTNIPGNPTSSDTTTEHYLLIFPGHEEYPKINPTIRAPSKVGDKNITSDPTSSDSTTEHYLLIFPGHEEYPKIKPTVRAPSKVGDNGRVDGQTGSVEFKTNFTTVENNLTQSTTKNPLIEDDKFQTDFENFKCPENLKCVKDGICIECD